MDEEEDNLFESPGNRNKNSSNRESNLNKVHVKPIQGKLSIPSNYNSIPSNQLNPIESPDPVINSQNIMSMKLEKRFQRDSLDLEKKFQADKDYTNEFRLR